MPRRTYFAKYLQGVTMNIDVQTPKWLKKLLFARFQIDHDPCPYLGLVNGPDGLDRNIPWGKNNYINPPYDIEMLKFVERAQEEMKKGNNSYFLIPLRFATKYYDEIFKTCTDIEFFADRIAFKGYEKQYPQNLALFFFEAGQTPCLKQVVDGDPKLDNPKKGRLRTWRLTKK